MRIPTDTAKILVTVLFSGLILGIFTLSTSSRRIVVYAYIILSVQSRRFKEFQPIRAVSGRVLEKIYRYRKNPQESRVFLDLFYVVFDGF
jgi:hypothetical protein